MKVLWITNILFPDVCKEIGIPLPTAGGWMYSSAKRLVADNNIELAVASIYEGKELKRISINNITYFLLPNSYKNTKYNPKLESYWQQIQILFKPEIVHIHGTEYAHGLAYIKACGNEKVVISIQGLVSVIERYYYAGMSVKDVLTNITFRDIIRNDNILQQRKKMKLRGEIEKEYLIKGKHFIGRTSWDKAHISAINPNANYHFCNETLREEFYKHTWSFEQCDKHSIFLSQAAYPIKGLHQVIKALPLVLRHYPDLKLYVAGQDFVNTHTWKEKIRLGSYGKYVQNLISKFNLNEYINFTGPLDEKEMCSMYLKSNIFICPSSIENSPNSLGEAQLLGVPCVSSYSGGTPDMIKSEYTGILYRFEEVEVLADTIIRLFNNKNLMNTISVNGRYEALKRHSSKVNKEMLISIYLNISNKC